MNTKYHDSIFAVISFAIIVVFFILNLYTPLIADDFGYSSGIHSVFDILIRQYNHYFNWGGRSVAHFLAQFWLFAGKPLFNIANTIIYCSFIWLVQFHITGNFKKSNVWFVLINLYFWSFVPAWGQNFLWLTGSCNYLWTTVMILFFLVPFRKKQENPAYSINILLSILFFIFGILAGWSVENSGAAVIFLLLAYFIVKIVRRNNFSLFEILGAAGFLVGFIFLISAPGNAVRIESIRQAGYGYVDDPFIIRSIKRFVDISINISKKYGLYIIPITILFGYDLLVHQKRKLHIFSYFYVLAVFVSIYSMVLSPEFPERAFLMVFVFAFIAFCNVITQMNFRIPNFSKIKFLIPDFIKDFVPVFVKRNVFVFIFLAGIYLSFPFIMNPIKDIAKVFFRWHDRIEYILAEKEKGNLELSVPPILAVDRHTASWRLDDVFFDKNYWTNTSISKYFNITSLERMGDESSKIELRINRIRQVLVLPWIRLKNLVNQ